MDLQTILTCIYLDSVTPALPEGILPYAPLGGEAGNGPHPNLDPEVELLPPHVPHPLVWQSLSFGLKSNTSHQHYTRFLTLRHDRLT